MDSSPWIEKFPAGETTEHISKKASMLRDQFGIGLASFTAVFSKDLSQVLLVQLGDYAREFYNGNPWTLPGGGVDPGEDSLAAGKREVLEESGIDLANCDFKVAAWINRTYYQSRNAESQGEIILLFATVWDGDYETQPKVPEIKDARFVTFELDEWLTVPSKNTGEHPLQPLPKHWIHWTRQAQEVLAEREQPVAITCNSYKEMAAPIEA